MSDLRTQPLPPHCETFAQVTTTKASSPSAAVRTVTALTHRLSWRRSVAGSCRDAHCDCLSVPGAELRKGRSAPAFWPQPRRHAATVSHREGTRAVVLPTAVVQGCWFARPLIAGRVSAFCTLGLGFPIHLDGSIAMLIVTKSLGR